MTKAPPTTTNNRGIKTPPFTLKTPTSKLQLCIVDAINTGTNLASLRRDLNMKESAFQYHLSILKKQGVIRKVGYGTWEIIDQPQTAKKTTTVSSYVGADKYPTSQTKICSSPAVLSQGELSQFVPDAVRAHAFVFTLQVRSNLRNWNCKKRVEFMTRKEIPFKQLNIRGGGQRIIIKGKKIWLLDRSIIIYDKSSYFAEDALRAKGTALSKHISIIKHIERLLHVSFLIGDDYKFKVSRQHYALIQNALAKQYNTLGEKLEVRNGRGLWFLIDNSYNLNEAETVHPSSAATDNMKVQGYFNGIKEMPAINGAPSYTPGFVLEMMHGIQANQAVFAENMVSHIEAVQALSAGVKDMTASVSRLQLAQRERSRYEE